MIQAFRGEGFGGIDRDLPGKAEVFLLPDRRRSAKARDFIRVTG